MAAAGDFVARNAKAVVSAVGGVLTVGTAATALVGLVPTQNAPLAGGAAAILVGLEVLRTLNVWIVKNEPVLEAAANAGEELVNEAKAVVAEVRGGFGHSDPAAAAKHALGSV
jgi:hypothetical protein